MSQRESPCEFCDTHEPQQKKRVTVTRQWRGIWYIFEDVEAWVCPHCGHRTFDADMVSAMEERMSTPAPDARPVTAWAISLAQSKS